MTRPTRARADNIETDAPERPAAPNHGQKLMTMQPHCLRLVYASRANFSAGADNSTVNADVARILMQSRRNNPANGLVGALYFADGCFFQCLEGAPEAVDGLYARLHDDPRHRELKVLSRAEVERPSFARWSMKFVPNASAVGSVLRAHGLETFDPYRFSPAALADMVALLVEGSDSGTAPHAGNAPATIGHAPVDRPLALARQARGLAVVAIVLSMLSMGLALLR